MSLEHFVVPENNKVLGKKGGGDSQKDKGINLNTSQSAKRKEFEQQNNKDISRP